jgi:hypothetical protein
MRKTWTWPGSALCAVGLLAAIAHAAQTGRLIFLSTQLRPIEEAQKMRNVILKDFPREVIERIGAGGVHRGGRRRSCRPMIGRDLINIRHA